MKKVLLLISLFILLPSIAAKPSRLDKVKIISAEQLNYKDGNSVLIGNVKIQLGEFMIDAPQVFIDSDKEGKAQKARFENGVVLDSEKLSIQTPRMELDVESSIVECFSDETTLVQTDIYGKNQATIFAHYQEIDLNKGFARASSTQESEQIKFISKDVNIRANVMELEFKNDKDIQYVNFLTNVVTLTDNQRIESQELLYFPQLDMMKAYDTVKVLYLKKDAPNYLFSDALIYEKPKHVISVFSRGIDRYAEIHSDDIYGKARQILVNLAEDNSIENAILTGNAYAQHKDKSIMAYEILFDAKKKQLETIVGRPHTLLLKTEKEDLKANSKKKKKTKR